MFAKPDSKEFTEYLGELIKDQSKIKHSNYDKTVEHAKEMAVHAWEEKPDSILEDFRPREEQNVRDYRLLSYEPITASKFDKCISILQKIFNPKIYSIKFPDKLSNLIKEEEDLKTYTLELFPHFDSVFMFVREVLLKAMIADPNAVISVVPGNSEADQTEYLKPVPVVFTSDQVLDYDKNNYFVLLDSQTIQYPKTTREGKIIHLFTSIGIYTYNEVLRPNRASEMVLVSEYVHDLGYVPCWHLGGVIEARKMPYYYKSFFNAAIPFWKKAIRHESDLDAAYVNHLFPQKWEYTIECDNSGCFQGQLTDIHTGNKTTCGRCKGSGRVKTTGPYDVMQIQHQTLDGDKNIPLPPAGYVTVPTEIVDKLENRVKFKISEGLSAINMDIVDSIGANQSGIAKEYDRSELYSFMQQISDYIFDNHISNIFFFINRYRYGAILGNKVDDNLPDISKPTQFDVLTITELTAEIAQATTAKVNPLIINAMEKDYISKKFSTNSQLQNTISAIIDLDPFPNVSTDEKMARMADGTISLEDVVISDNIKKFVYRANNENKGFFDMVYEDRYKILIKYAKEFLKAKNLLLGDATTLDGSGNSDTPIDVEAEAKAKLKGSVGGVQGILEIQKQVSEGITTYDAGLAILDLIYGIGPVEGKRILGDEQKILNDSKVKNQINFQPNDRFNTRQGSF